MSSLGTHYIWDIHEVDALGISHESDVKVLLHNLCGLTPLQIVGESYKQFEPVGVTAILLLSESHLSIHTWPEHNFIAIDLFSCRPIDHQAITAFIKKEYDGAVVDFRVLQRGVSQTVANEL